MKIKLSELLQDRYPQNIPDVEFQKHGSGPADDAQLASTANVEPIKEDNEQPVVFAVIPFTIKRKGTGDFYVQMDGENAGRPFKIKPDKGNYYPVTVDRNVLLPDYFYYMIEYLYSTGAFKPYLHGVTLRHLTVKGFIEAVIRHLFSKKQ